MKLHQWPESMRRMTAILYKILPLMTTKNFSSFEIPKYLSFLSMAASLLILKRLKGCQED
jgi:hypothetical protein